MSRIESDPDRERDPGGGEDQKEHSPRRKQMLADLDSYVLPSLLIIVIVALVAMYPILGLYALIAGALLTPCVLLHEWGHYRVARKADLGIEEFSMGFGKRLLSRVDANGVRWSLKAIPLGGSVEIKGMTVEDAEVKAVPREKAFVYAPIKTRLKVAFMGVFMNLLLAWAALTVAFITLSPEGPTLRTILISPVGAVLLLGSFVIATMGGLWSAVVNWNADVSSILRMPQVLETGAAEATDTGMPLWLYFVIILSLLNLSLAVFNALPMYPLDGYHGLVAAFDGVRNLRARRSGDGALPPPLRMAQLTTFSRTTFTLLGVFVVSVFSRDIIRMISG